MIENAIEVAISNGFYMGAFLLEQFAQANQGVLFVPLSWHQWCVHVIGPMSVPPVVPVLEAVAQHVASMMTVTAAERLVDDVLWYKPGGAIEKVELVGEGVARRATSPELAKALAG